MKCNVPFKNIFCTLLHYFKTFIFIGVIFFVMKFIITFVSINEIIGFIYHFLHYLLIIKIFWIC